MKKIIALLTVLFVILGLSIPAFASTDIHAAPEAFDKVKMSEMLLQNGVSTDKVQGLLDKLQNNILPDSVNPTKIALVPEGVLNATMDEPYKKYVFPDGSFIEKKITVLNKIKLIPENREELIAAVGSAEKADEIFAKAKELQNQKKKIFRIMSVTGGSTYNIDNSTWEVGTWVQENQTVAYSGFGADFVIVWGGVDYINSVYNWSITTFGGTYNDVTLTIDRKYEEQYTGRPAVATLKFDYVVTGGITESTYHTSLNVGNNSYYSSAW